ncbi:MAG: serine--tRNA ligase [Phycisphaeraceae bacterium]|nr:serine--tRNA ligase [Phycisphaeraceae bacterium]
MIDLRDLRENPDRYRAGCAAKNDDPAIVDRLLELDARLRQLIARRETLAAEKNRLGKDIGELAGRLKKAADAEKERLQKQMAALQKRPAEIKAEEGLLDHQIAKLEPQRDKLWLCIPQPPDPEVPVGPDATANAEIARWNPPRFDPARTFAENRGFEPRSHIELMTALEMVDFERAVKLSGSRSYVLKGDGMRLHNALLQFAFSFMHHENGFTPMSVPVLVRESAMLGTGFFPQGRDQAYAVGDIEKLMELLRDHSNDKMVDDEFAASKNEGYLTGTGEVGLMGFHQDEILDFDALPLKYTTVSTCFRREAGAAGKDTAGLYRIHQFDKVEQVVICRADERESRQWHQTMIGFVRKLLETLELPYRLLQCCTGDLGPKNADMIDIECWMPSRGEVGPDGKPTGAYSETHSASRLYDYQCRRLNIRYRDPETGKTTVCHSLNNTVLASPRILIPIVEIYQDEDGSITIPEPLRPWMGGRDRIG